MIVSIHSLHHQWLCPAAINVFVSDGKIRFSFQWLSRVWLFATPRTAACQACLSITNSRSLLKLMSVMSVMPSNQLILCRPFLLPPSIFPSIRVFSKEPVLHIRWPTHWSFSFSISPSNGWAGWISLQSKRLSRVFKSSSRENHYEWSGPMGR